MNHVERKLETIQDMKYEVQKIIVFNEEQMENFQEWSNQLEERVLHYDILVDKFKKELRATMNEEEDQENGENFRSRMEEKLEIEKKKLKTQK